MFELVKFKKDHLKPMIGQPQNHYLETWMENGNADLMEAERASFTGLVKGIPAVCGGVNHFTGWPDRGHLWAIWNSEFSGFRFIPVFRGLRHFLRDYPCRRIEMAVPCSCLVGNKRAKLMGFTLECARAKFYLPNGDDCSLYALVRG